MDVEGDIVVSSLEMGSTGPGFEANAVAAEACRCCLNSKRQSRQMSVVGPKRRVNIRLPWYGDLTHSCDTQKSALYHIHVPLQTRHNTFDHLLARATSLEEI